MDKIISEIKEERYSQDRKWGIQNHNPEWWMQILMEEVGEVSKALLEAKFGNWSLSEYRKEMVQVAAVAVVMLECFDRNSSQPITESDIEKGVI